MLYSEKSQNIINKQKPIDKKTVARVKNALAVKGIVLEQSVEWDNYLVVKGMEAVTYNDKTIIMHTNVSASGFYEKLIHYGQLKKKHVELGDEEEILLLEIEAQERLIKNQRAYKITDFEIEILTKNLNWYIIQLEKLRKDGI